MRAPEEKVAEARAAPPTMESTALLGDSAPGPARRAATTGSSSRVVAATAMGAGLLSLPHALDLSGLALGLPLVLLLAVAATATLGMLVSAGRMTRLTVEERTYVTVTTELMGPRVGRVAATLVTAAVFFTLVMSCIVVVDMAPILVAEVAPEHEAVPRHVWVAAGFVLTLPGAFLSRLDSLRPTVWAQLVLLAAFVASLVSRFALEVVRTRHVPPLGHGRVPTIPSHPLDVSLSCTIITQALVSHINIFTVESELPARLRQKIFSTVCVPAMTFVTCMYIAGGLAGFLSLGRGVPNDVLKGYSEAASYPEFAACRAAILVVNVVKLPLVEVPLRELVFGKARPNHFAARVLAVHFVLWLITLLLPSLSKELELGGALTGTFLVYVMPASLALKAGVPGRSTRTLAWVLVLLAPPVGLVAFCWTVASWRWQQ